MNTSTGTDAALIRALFDQQFEQTEIERRAWHHSRGTRVRLAVIAEAIERIVRASEWADSTRTVFTVKDALNVLHQMKDPSIEPLEEQELE